MLREKLIEEYITGKNYACCKSWYEKISFEFKASKLQVQRRIDGFKELKTNLGKELDY